ncbi:hypothetical protein DSAG12_04105 [Promethearchaeum syntrophicum]|uniref:Uncharacterized protein n=1 Tax=Promethearchaeum syntrophicum TaxID=2594042 RepID=A0AC61ZTV8_9ARCH|nr:hypothetical protein [Candidatus Prometheoarchaeum syntrophicum]
MKNISKSAIIEDNFQFSLQNVQMNIIEKYYHELVRSKSFF